MSATTPAPQPARKPARKSARTLGLAALASLSLVGMALAATTSVKFYINGTKNSLDAVIIDGRAYVPVSALKAAGVNVTATSSAVNLTLAGTSAAGGANQVTAVEGCLGQTLFNGVWRMKVLSVKPGEANGKQGLLVTVELRNGTPRTQYVYGTGLSNSNEAYYLVTPDGNTSAWGTYYTLNAFADRNVPQGGMFTYTFQFWPEDVKNVVQPSKFLMLIKNPKSKDVPYSVADPSFRVDLTCQK